MKNWLVPAIAGIGLIGSANVSRGYTADTCNGSHVKWRGTLDLHRNKCSIPDSGNINSAYWNAVDQWNDLTGEVDHFYVRPASDCSSSHDDGINEIGLVNRTDIDGANGLTVNQVGACFIGANDIDESDVYIANDLAFDNKQGNFLGTAGRSTFVHEIGHLFGFNHEQAHGVMRTTPPHLLTGGSESSTVWPTESMGIYALYGLSSGLPNILPSALGIVGGSVNLLNTGSVNRCRNEATNVSFYIGNAGSSATGTYEIRIRLSTSATSTGGTHAAFYDHSFTAFSEGTYSLPFNVPDVSNGTYFIHVDVDPDSGVAEVREGDNRTVSGMKVIVSC